VKNLKKTTKITAIICLTLISGLVGTVLADYVITYHISPSPIITVVINSPTPPPTTPPPTPVQVSTSIQVNGGTGTVTMLNSDALLITVTLDHTVANVPVVIQELNANGVFLSDLGTATTNANGVAVYTYNGPYSIGTHYYKAVPQTPFP
jgi:hypothetical protein